MSLILVIITAALVDNVVLSQFYGLCPFLGVSKQVKTAAGMGAAIVFVVTVSSAICAILYDLVLVTFDITYLKTIVFIIIIAALVQLVEMVLKKVSRPLYVALGVYLPLITTNCCVLGTVLTNVQKEADFVTSVCTGLGASLGFTLSIVLMAGVREKLAHNNVTKSFQGMPVVLLSACLMAIAFYGFKSLV